VLKSLGLIVQLSEGISLPVVGVFSVLKMSLLVRRCGKTILR
jgi:hypothetical protein